MSTSGDDEGAMEESVSTSVSAYNASDDIDACIEGMMSIDVGECEAEREMEDASGDAAVRTSCDAASCVDDSIDIGSAFASLSLTGPSMSTDENDDDNVDAAENTTAAAAVVVELCVRGTGDGVDVKLIVAMNSRREDSVPGNGTENRTSARRPRVRFVMGTSRSTSASDFSDAAGESLQEEGDEGRPADGEEQPSTSAECADSDEGWEVEQVSSSASSRPGAADVPAIDVPAEITPALAGSGLRRWAVGVVYDPVMALHIAPDGDHVERPERITTIMEALGLARWTTAEESCSVKDGTILERCRVLRSRRADDKELLLAHSYDHVRSVDKKSQSVTGNGVSYGDIYFNSSTSAAARMAAGCVIEACERVVDGSVRASLAVVRPPGHHAECSREMGFCFFNNVAVAALQLLQFHSHAVQRVVIVDWDVHHGNGIQNILEERDDVMYISLHRFTRFFYPGTGAADEVGIGAGAGKNVNVPFDAIGMNDTDYLAAFDLVLAPIIRQFAPDIIIVSAGFDAIDGDPLGGMCVSPEGYAHMTRRLQALSKHGRIVLALEGGYDVHLNALCVKECMKVLLDDGDRMPDIGSRLRIKSSTEATLRGVAALHSQFCEELRSEAWQAQAELAFKHLHEFKSADTPRRTPRRTPGKNFQRKTGGVAFDIDADTGSSNEAAARTAEERSMPESDACSVRRSPRVKTSKR